MLNRARKEHSYLFIFQKLMRKNNMNPIPWFLGCKLLIDSVTKKFRVLKIPIHSLGCELQNTSFPAQYEEETNCFVISLRSLSPEDRVKTEVDYRDSIIFDTKDDKIVGIEIIGGSQLLDL